MYLKKNKQKTCKKLNFCSKRELFGLSLTHVSTNIDVFKQMKSFCWLTGSSWGECWSPRPEPRAEKTSSNSEGPEKSSIDWKKMYFCVGGKLLVR